MTQQREALRQQMLLRALWHDARVGVLQGWVSDDKAARGLRAYRANAGASAETALAAAFPTVVQLVGDESFAALARAFWQAEPPTRGDLAWFGEHLPMFIENSEQLADETFLADCARLDWAVHRVESAADADDNAESLSLLSTLDPSQLRLKLRPGTTLIVSPHPVATIWLAHRSDAVDRFAPVREAFAAGRAENALVWRDGWRARVSAISDADARFTQAVIDRMKLADALAHAGDGFDFQPWLITALQQRWLVGAEPHTTP
jgi:hypothetical protein